MRIFLLAITLALGLATLQGCAPLQPLTVSPTAVSPEAVAVADKPAELSPIGKTNVTGNTVANLNLPNDLWERIRKGYKMPNLETDLVVDRTQWYAAKTDLAAYHWVRSTTRSVSKLGIL